jgi:hypothetical protein
MPVSTSPPFLRIALAILISGIAAHALGVLGDGDPTIRSPYPLALTLIVFLGAPVLLPSVVMGGLFYVSSRRALRVTPSFSWLAALLLSISIIASLATFIGGWNYGVQYQGRRFVLICAWISAIFAAALCVIFALCWRKHTNLGSLAFYFLFYAWLSTYAFPYMGEGP